MHSFGILSLTTAVITAVQVTAAPTNGGYVATQGPFALKVNSANSTFQNHFLTAKPNPQNPSEFITILNPKPDISFYWLPNSANPVPPSPTNLPQGKLLYESKIPGGKINYTVGISSTQDIDNQKTSSVIMKMKPDDGFDIYNAYGFYPKLSPEWPRNISTMFVEDVARWVGCVDLEPLSGEKSLRWVNGEEVVERSENCDNVLVGAQFLPW